MRVPNGDFLQAYINLRCHGFTEHQAREELVKALDILEQADIIKPSIHPNSIHLPTMKCWFCFGMGRVAPENWDIKGMVECPECKGTGLTHCPYCDEPVQLKGEDLLAWCPEHGVLENDLKRGGSVPGCVNDGEQTQP